MFKLKILKLLKKIMGTQTELAQQLNAVTAQLAKIGTETAATLQKVADLETLLGTVTPEVQDALDKLKAQAKIVDDLVADAPEPEA